MRKSGYLVTGEIEPLIHRRIKLKSLAFPRHRHGHLRQARCMRNPASLNQRDPIYRSPIERS